MTTTLRPYQSQAIGATREAYRTVKRVVLAAPTGSGKTVIGVEIIRLLLAKGRRCAFVAHRRELITQCSQHLTRLGLPHGIIQADRPKTPDAPVQVCSIDSLRTRARPPADFLMIDEAHHTMASGYRALIDNYPQAWVLGLTATPARLDGKGLGDVFQKLIVVAQPQELIDQGFLVQPRVFAPSRPDMRGVRKTGGDYSPEQAAEKMATVTGDIAEHLERHAPDLRTVVYACTIAHSQAIAAAIGAEHLDGTTPTEERDAILGRLRSGETKRVCNVGVLTEGYDLPELGCVVHARPTQSLTLYLQICGRALRPADGKAQPIILDHAGNCIRHGHPTEDRQWALTETTEVKEKAPPTYLCRACFFISGTPFDVCPQCGMPREVHGREITEDDGQLEEVVPRAVRLAREKERRQDAWDALAAEARATGRKIGWAKHRFKERFGVWPSAYLRAGDREAWSWDKPAMRAARA